MVLPCTYKQSAAAADDAPAAAVPASSSPQQQQQQHDLALLLPGQHVVLSHGLPSFFGRFKLPYLSVKFCSSSSCWSYVG
jgi:hypothetical protein